VRAVLGLGGALLGLHGLKVLEPRRLGLALLALVLLEHILLARRPVLRLIQHVRAVLGLGGALLGLHGL